MEKANSKVKYDDRRKELTHQVDSEQEAKNNDGETVGIVTTKMTGVYKEEGIRKMVGEMNADMKKLKDAITKIEKSLEKMQDIKETEEIKKWREIQEVIPKIREKEQFENQLAGFKEQLSQTEKNLGQIKKEIGSRLKL